MSGVSNAAPSAAPLVAHVVHRFDYGGLENGLVNVINTMDASTCRHAVIALTEATGFAARITRRDTSVHSLHKRPGKDWGAYVRLWRLLRELRPSVLHTRNIGTLDCVLIGRLAGVASCVHGEHGWDTHDPDGTSVRYRWFRKILNPLVSRFIAVSEDLGRWLVDVVGIASAKVEVVCNGVDINRFHPARAAQPSMLPPGFRGDETVVVGSVTRFEDIKDPLNLVTAFIGARDALAESKLDLRLVMLGDGSLKAAAVQMLANAGVAEFCWLPGMRDDIPQLMREFDIFALASRREGISNTILEALACGLPVVTTRTGGNPELIRDGEVGALVEPQDPRQLAMALAGYARSPETRRRHGAAARQRAERHYSLEIMAESYRRVYSTVLATGS